MARTNSLYAQPQGYLTSPRPLTVVVFGSKSSPSQPRPYKRHQSQLEHIQAKSAIPRKYSERIRAARSSRASISPATGKSERVAHSIALRL